MALNRLVGHSVEGKSFFLALHLLNVGYRSHMYRYDKEIAKNRFIVERTNAWLKGFRRLRCRFDYQTASFEAFLYLAIIIICVRRLVL
jgi:transposase